MKAINLLFICLISFVVTNAQTNDSLNSKKDTTKIENSNPNAEITFKDGNILRGRIIKQTESFIIFKSDIAGEVTIPTEKILNIKFFDNNHTGNQQVYINLASRYFFSPSAINMKKGDGYYQNTWFSLSTFNYAFTNYFTLGGGFELFTLLSGHPLFMITPKVSVPITKNLHIGGGYMYIGILGDNMTKSFFGNIAYGNFTLGNEDANISMNVGTNIKYGGKPVYTINAFIKVSPKFGFMTENWIIPTASEYYSIYSLGGRIIGRKNLFDFALITNSEIAQNIPAIPYLTYTLRF
ncbi:MAG: hypothetical protein WCO54_10175 [Bacteroidota bacterium]